ncbi:MAG: hypothetical protein ACI9UK_000186 [Candidatus Krumholzibacteriia bacterium]|jgi:hypothetical protein
MTSVAQYSLACSWVGLERTKWEYKMKKFTMFAVLTMAVTLAVSATAGGLHQLAKGNPTIIGGSSSTAKAAGDTIDVMGPTGSGAPYLGDFEAGWNGWTNIDATQQTVTHWNVSTYNQAVVGNFAAWCGDISIAACDDSLDQVGGYGNSWNDLLAYRATVANPTISALVTVTATLQNDTEPGYDYTRLSAKLAGNIGYTDIQSWDGQATIGVNNSITYLPGEYVDGTDVHMLWRVETDPGWSDKDCLWPSSGACQIDDITVLTTQVGEADISYFEDFQSETFGSWFIAFPVGVGNFAALWTGLDDLDPCRTNYSQQVAYIDDGIVVPGTGGSDCINWCYGPTGYIVSTSGGLVGPGGHTQVLTSSPVMAWPDPAYNGMIFSFDVFRHEILDADSPGVFYEWAVRSADTDGSAGSVQVLADQSWRDRGLTFLGGPDYFRHSTGVATDLMNPGRDEFQVQVSVFELGWAFGFTGHDGYPAPYFDNISVKVFPFLGPGMSAREFDMAQDTFAEVDALPTAGGAIANAAALATMHVRFDAANNISFNSDMRNDPGDSITVTIVPVRSGAVLTQTEMHYSIDTNPIFDPSRIGGFSATGVVVGKPAVRFNATSTTKWAFDLPDSGFLFPGDVLHYYFRAADDLAGDILYGTLPADITGFGDFTGGPLAYNSSFTMHALPSIRATATPDVYEQPAMVFWNDNGNRGGEEEWYSALSQLGYQAGEDYDIYYTNGPSSARGNGIGGRTSGLALEDYTTMLYSAGSLGTATISNGDFNFDAGDDISAMSTWLSVGNKNVFMTGDSVAHDLGNNAGAAGLSFLETVMGLNLTTNDVRGFIDNQATPLVLAVAGNSVISSLDSWIAYGGCAAINTFDGVTVRPGAERLAEFADSDDAPNGYTFSALTLNVHNLTNCIISQPYDFQFIYDSPSAVNTGSFTGRIALLDDVLMHFGSTATNAPSAVLPTARFAASNFPNPFNPSTKISYTIKAAGHLSVKVYNVRGQLVKTLVDRKVTGNGFVTWNGKNNQGTQVSSGVYFYEARMGHDVEVNKMVLVK